MSWKQDGGQEFTWAENSVPVAAQSSEVRADFIRKTYIHLLLGLMAFSGVVAGIMSSPKALELCFRVGIWPALIGMLLLSFGYRYFFASANLASHYVGYGLTILFYAILSAPLFAIANARVPGVLTQAFILTSVVFGGLTAVALISRRDFSFMGRFLTIATFALIGIALLGMFFGGLGLGSGLSFVVILVFGGWVLYDTSMIQHHLPPHGYVVGATMLLIDFVVILRQMVMLLAMRDE